MNNNTITGTAPAMQLTLRKALLHKAGPETKNKFTGHGYGESHILREDGEDIIATVMAVSKAERTNTEIRVGDAIFKAGDFPQIGTGLAKVMNWNGHSYYSDVDDERTERSFVTRVIPDYVQDSVTVGDKTYKAEGKIVSPQKLTQLINSFNALNGKAGDDHKVTVGSSVSKSYIKFGNFNYLIMNGVTRRVAESTEGYSNEFCTFVKPTIAFEGLTIGSMTDDAPEVKVWEYLF